MLAEGTPAPDVAALDHLHVEAPALSITELRADSGGEPSVLMRERIETARQLQLIRFRGTPLTCNARMPPSQLKRFCAI